ncbi:DUF2934 domain-containing protein [Pseudomonas sp. SWRI111]|uniref:DUF2934 domain-containing protein n=1 Tax=Pseudomonas sp. SWRI111 TaxID=2745507 RepID=UPI0016479EAC|nr:DUF2934 domain-containing protein [Pseudomonas sp. SWRI111]MBC3205194.1 DUF2934 domain-containing protein [Pseudomonas sp. SWRI111]
MDEETLRKTAYRIWEEQGRPHGQDFEHWFQAQAELDAFDSDGLPGSIASSVAPPAPKKKSTDTPASAEKKPRAKTPSAKK